MIEIKPETVDRFLELVSTTPDVIVFIDYKNLRYVSEKHNSTTVYVVYEPKNNKEFRKIFEYTLQNNIWLGEIKGEQ